MNERIKKLAEQTGIHFGRSATLDGNDIARFVTTSDMEKFAELIVRECAEQIVAKGTDWVDFAPSQTGVRPEYWSMAQHIKEHFGVTE